ncbi:lysyl oxidase homolog 3 [Diachasma alloeum]|uniref:lysyl oxidase homolog 3 n=1 Tax=Diachasma alloeum TaxID=454923 RepID=UPI0007382270|nr:lysyl oxidase homolog 3 [Diachasma alloeum]XP_015121136.1 lysyl oxidase homolog 3 [Diachasma alloeum]XP_015121137.1 lysyl oxidase homolog 3 [Diachasma alloeum]XP_015121138.1 lysyl oxidase homolog 3 [Diachasma alloeum]
MTTWKIAGAKAIIIVSIFALIVDGGNYPRDPSKKAKYHLRRLSQDFRRLKKQEGAIKLVGGRQAFEGNLEILHDGKWGSVCDDEWDHLEATVVCRQLGFEGALEATGNSRFGQARRRFWMDNIFCDGREDYLGKCRFDGWGNSDCQSNEAAGVICTHDKEGDLPSPSISTRRIKIKEHHPRLQLRVTGGRNPSEGRVEIKFPDEDWGMVCGDGWSLLEASVICRQLNLGYASSAIQTTLHSDKNEFMSISGIRCRGNEHHISECLHDSSMQCPGRPGNVASVACRREMADLVIDHIELMRTAHLEDRPLFWLQCAMEENCVASEAYRIQKESDDWLRETRRLLKFTARILNAGTADFRPSVPKHLWEWHMCHMHYHSMEVFATFDIIDSTGKRIAEGHKASFCLEDNLCMPGVKPRYKCANYGDQGISVNCTDIYRYNIDCQWIDISELEPGQYSLKVAVNPEFKIGEMSFENNAAECRLLYTESQALVHDCVVGRP